MAENKTLEHLPEVRAAVAALSPEDREVLAAVQTSPFKLTAPEQFKEFAANIDYFVFEPNIHDLNDLGWRYLAQHMDMLLPPELLKAIDPVPFGKYAMQEEQGHFTKHGYISLSGDEWNHERPAEPEKKPSIRERLEQGKLIGFDLNRGLRDENGEIYDIVAGTFLVVGLGEEDFASLSPELIQKYTEQFKTPERFMQINGNIVVLPVPAEKQDLAYLPDRFETGERIQTPRGSFQVTAMSREQMEAAGYGVHHISDDGKYLIMGNGTRAFAVAAEPPEKNNPLRTAEMTLEDDYGMIDGVINNGRRGEELKKAQEYAERTTPEKPSIHERLEDAKRECAEHKPQEGKKPGRDVPEHDCL